jgi:renalase
MAVLIVGAGIAGLTAAHELRAHGHEVVLVDKGHRPGGRVATRSVGTATFDHGAQFFTTKDPWFRERVAIWRAEGVVRSWFHGSPDRDAPADPDGYPRFRGTPTMRRLAEHLAAGLDLHLGTVVQDVTTTAGRWRLTTELRDGSRGPDLLGDALVLTAPAAQSLALLDAGEVAVSSRLRGLLEDIEYDPCVAVLAVPSSRPTLPARGALRLPQGPIGWLTDNATTGASAAPAVTIHASADHSRARFDVPDRELGEELVALSRDHLGTDARPVAVHRWRYSNPVGRAPVDAVVESVDGAPLAVAGDAMVGGRIEGAALSGLAAARELARTVDPSTVAEVVAHRAPHRP